MNIANYNPRASSGDLCSYRCPNPNPILVLDGNLCAARPDQFKDRNIRGFGFPRPSSIDVVELAAAGDKKQPVFDARRVKRLNRTTRSREEFKLETLRSKREFQERKNEFEPKAPRRDMSEAAFDPDRLLATRLDHASTRTPNPNPNPNPNPDEVGPMPQHGFDDRTSEICFQRSCKTNPHPHQA